MKHHATITQSLVVIFVVLASGFATAAEPAVARQVRIEWAKLRSVNPQEKPATSPTNGWTVVCFLGTECPLTRLYGQRLSLLAGQFESKGVQFVGINSNPQDSPEEIQQYIAKFE